MDMNMDKLREMVKDREASGAAIHAFAESDMTGQLNNSNKNIQYIIIMLQNFNECMIFKFGDQCSKNLPIIT